MSPSAVVPALGRDLISTGALATLLVVAFAHPRGRVELLAAAAAAGAVLLTGAVSPEAAAEQLRLLGPVVAFLIASLVVAEACAAAGVFTYLGQVVARIGRHEPARTATVAFAVATVVTVVLSLDATVVMLTPVVLAAAAGHRATRPMALLCARLANSASLLLPVSNLTNLLAVGLVGLGFSAWVGWMVLPWLGVLAVEYVALHVAFRRDLRGPLPRHAALEDGPARAPRAALAVLGVMLVGFALASPLGVDPAWVAGAAAFVLALPALRRGALAPRDVLASAHLPFAAFVLGLGVVVAAVADSFLGNAVADLLPAPGGDEVGDLGTLMLIAFGTMALATLLNNLPATLLVVPLVVPLGIPAVLAAILGVNVGAGLAYSGSLANLLWRRVLRRQGAQVDGVLFHRYAVVVTPVALAVGTFLLWAEAARRS